MTSNSDQIHEEADVHMPASPHYEPLVWSGDESGDDVLEIEARGEDWNYNIWSDGPEPGEPREYYVSGGDIEESCDLGSFDSLEDAKDAAQRNYAERYCEAEQLLFDAISGYQDNDGQPLARQDTQGRIYCRIHGFDSDIEIAATLQDYADRFDVTQHLWTVCLRSILVYLSGQDWVDGLREDMRVAGVTLPEE